MVLACSKACTTVRVRLCEYYSSNMFEIQYAEIKVKTWLHLKFAFALKYSI